MPSPGTTSTLNISLSLLDLQHGYSCPAPLWISRARQVEHLGQFSVGTILGSRSNFSPRQQLEERDQPYLPRLRQTQNVQRLVAQQCARDDWSRPDSQGCQMVEASLQLHGWSKKRRVVIVRQRIRGGIARERRMDGKQLKLDLADPSVHEGDKLCEYAVLVTDVSYRWRPSPSSTVTGPMPRTPSTS
jgi:hypothetical protein